MKILTLCGSIRDTSSNRFLLEVIKPFFSAETEWSHFEIRTLPFFDPQLQFSAELPDAVRDLRGKAQQSDWILIATPEYAHGIPGVLKNALEWMLCEETMRKKVALLIGTSSGGQYVQQQLIETLCTMDLIASQEMTLVVRNARNLVREGAVEDPRERNSLNEFVKRISK